MVSLSLQVFNSLFMLGMSVSFGLEFAGTLRGAIGSLLLGSCVGLLGVKVMLLHSMQITPSWVECGALIIGL